MTRPGVILGTAAYMSPEQARGAMVDKRADIWAFGVVLFEMLAGHSCFTGETITDLLAAVVRAEPGWAKLPPGTPPRVRDLLHRCLPKDRKRRLHDIADARLELEEALVPGTSIAPGTEAVHAPGRRSGVAHLERSVWLLLVIIIAGVTFFSPGGSCTSPPLQSGKALCWVGQILLGSQESLRMAVRWHFRPWKRD